MTIERSLLDDGVLDEDERGQQSGRLVGVGVGHEQRLAARFPAFHDEDFGVGDRSLEAGTQSLSLDDPGNARAGDDRHR